MRHPAVSALVSHSQNLKPLSAAETACSPYVTTEYMEGRQLRGSVSQNVCV